MFSITVPLDKKKGGDRGNKPSPIWDKADIIFLLKTRTEWQTGWRSLVLVKVILQGGAERALPLPGRKSLLLNKRTPPVLWIESTPHLSGEHWRVELSPSSSKKFWEGKKGPVTRSTGLPWGTWMLCNKDKTVLSCWPPRQPFYRLPSSRRFQSSEVDV